VKNNKLKPGEIRVTPLDNRLNEMPPFINSVETQPAWFKRIHKNPGSLRRCAGINDFFNIGITIPCWTNFNFRPGQDGAWETRGAGFGFQQGETSMGAVESFPFAATGECPVSAVRSSEFSEAQYPKLVNPWKIETAPGWSVLILPVMWEPNKDYDVLPAAVHTDFYHTANIVLNIKADSAFSIKWGTPLAHLIPFERKTNIDKLIIPDEKNFKYVASKGFGTGHIMPFEGTAAPYRRERIRVDKEITDLALQKKGIISRFFSDNM
jgi:hypothetical protein